MIGRMTPDVDYVSPAPALGFNLLAKKDDLLFVAGLAPFKGPELAAVNRPPKGEV